MRLIKFLAILVLGMVSSVFVCSAQYEQYCKVDGNKFVITTPSAKLYPLPESYREAVTSGKALSYGIRDFVDISEIKPKTIRQSIQLPVVRYTNVTKSPNFDAYIVDYKDKLWVLQSSDVNINTLLVEQNAAIELSKEELESAKSSSLAKLQDLYSRRSVLRGELDSLVAHYAQISTDSLAYYRDLESRLPQIRDSLVRVAEREEQARVDKEYNSWYNSLPASSKAAVNAIIIDYAELDYPNSVGGCDYNFEYTNISPKTIKYLYWTGTAYNAVPTFTEGWNFSEKNGKKADWMGGVYTNCRNMAFGNGKLYIVDAPNGKIKVVKAQTAELIKELDMTGVADGALKVLDVAFVDGKLVASNIATKNADTSIATLKVYVWDNDDAAPKCILKTTNIGGMDRVGDAVEIKGNLTNGQICYLGQQSRSYTTSSGTTTTGNCNSLVTYAITNGTVSTTPVVKDIDGFIIGGSPRLIPFGNDYIAVGQNYRPSVVTAAGELTQSLTSTALQACQGNDIAVFSYKGDTYAFATEYDPGTAGDANTMLYNGRAALINLSDGWADATRKADYPSTGFSSNVRNTTWSSSICVNVNGDKGIEMWVLVHNQGIAYYKHGTVPTYTYDNTDTPVTPEPEPEPEPGESYSKGLTKIWQNTTKVPGSAAYNGTGPRYAAVSNGNLIVADNAGKSGSGKILKVDENGYSDYYDPTSAISSNYSLTLGSAIANDDAGNILVNTGFSGASSGSAFMIISADLSKTYKLDLAAAGIGGYATGIRTDQIGRIRGNMLSSEGAYFAFVPNSVTYAVVVKVVNGAVDASKSGVITTGFTSSTVTDIAQPAYEKVSEMSNNASSFYLRSRGVPASVYYEGAKKYTFSNKTTEGYTTTNASVEGFDWFKLGGKSYFIIPMTTDGTTANRGSMFGIFDQDGNIAAYWSTGQKSGLGAASGTFVAVPNDAYSVHIYHFVPGTVAEKLLFAPEDVTISTGVEEIATDVEAPVEYYNLQGVKVANPAKGLYIKKQGKKTTKVIL